MGIIKVKHAENYDYGPVNAASNYLGKNTTKIYSLPKVYQWKLVDQASFDYSGGFAVYGETVNDSNPFVGFRVCFLLNQTTGIFNLVEKVFDIQEGDGKITQRMRETLFESIITNQVDKKPTPQVFLDAAKNMLAKMNEVNESGSDLDFNYQFDLSSVPGLENSKIENLIPGLPSDTAYYPSKKFPTGSGRGTPFEELPGYFGSDLVWSHGSGMSFYDSRVSFSGDSQILQEELAEGLDSCLQDQSSRLDELRTLIEGGE